LEHETYKQIEEAGEQNSKEVSSLITKCVLSTLIDLGSRKHDFEHSIQLHTKHRNFKKLGLRLKASTPTDLHLEAISTVI
jgi:hypothetical protein